MYDTYILFMMSDIRSMLKRLESAIAVFLFGLIVSYFPLRGGNYIHERRMNWKDYVMI